VLFIRIPQASLEEAKGFIICNVPASPCGLLMLAARSFYLDGQIQLAQQFIFPWPESRLDLCLLELFPLIESGLHYRRDVTLREDATRFKDEKAAHNMAIVNNLVNGVDDVRL
jgi:hypothetical protein